MIFCETGCKDDTAFDTLAVFVSQARGNGLPAVISERSIPAGLKASSQFDVAPFLTEATPNAADHLLLLAADQCDQSRYLGLRDVYGGTAVKSIGFGNFQSRQSRITISSRLAYVLDQEPVLYPENPDFGLPAVHLPIFAAPLMGLPRAKPTVALFFPDLATPAVQSTILMMGLSRRFNVEIVTTGAEKKKWIDLHGHCIPCWHLGELLPRAISARFDIAVFLTKPATWPRLQMVFANLVQRGVALVDATLNRCWHSQIPQVIAGPAYLPDMGGWIERDILHNLPLIKAELVVSTLARQFDLPKVLQDLGRLPTPKPPRHGVQRPAVLFVPTNGVGLGHAKRCSLVADEMRDLSEPRFAAFPSCIGMLTGAGFDTVPLVSRASQRAGHDNDLVNFTRLTAAAQEAAAIVFDGGYVFDSVMRAAADTSRPSVWIRRGLWQAGQNNQVALDRQKTFTRIIVPTEVFDELNGRKETVENVIHVGPIVQRITSDPDEIARLRRNLEQSLDIAGKTLVVTMLGGGVAADRRAQINAICAHLAGRDDIMHLLVVWPTATTDPGWFQYDNTRVVQSIHASVLIRMADLFISAIGYNSFHEAIYAQVPTIFVPQMASFMDDQRARGQAAAERDVALLIEPWEMLRLTHAIDDCLGGHAVTLRDNLRRLNLPEPGAKAAARHILEVMP